MDLSALRQGTKISDLYNGIGSGRTGLYKEDFRYFFVSDEVQPVRKRRVLYWASAVCG